MKRKKRTILTLKGMALMTVLLLTALLVLMTVSMVFISTNHLSLIGNIEGKEKALKAAESGIEYAIGKLNEYPDWGTAPGGAGSAWGLDSDPVFPGHMVLNPDDSNTWPKFDPGVFTDEKKFTDDCGFIITFDPNIPNGSVNNLFSPVTETASNTPPYTAKIVSTGMLFSTGTDIPKATRTLVAYLTRSDFSPYNINVAGTIRFTEAGSGDITILGKGPNDLGSLYAGSEEPNSIVSGDIAKIISNEGIFSTRGTVDISSDFDGTVAENLTQNYSVQDMDVDNIVDSSGLTKENGGELRIAEIVEWNEGEYSSRIEIINGTGLNVGLAGSDLSLKENGSELTLTLEKDIHIQGSDLCIKGDFSSLVQENYSGTKQAIYDLYDPSIITGYEELSALKTSAPRTFYLDLNNHTIYSDKDLKLGVNVIGEGRIFSKKGAHYFISVNTNNTISMCNEDLVMEIANNVSSSSLKGLFYSKGNISVEPLTNGSELYWGWGVEKSETMEFARPDHAYPYRTTQFVSPPPAGGHLTTVGHFVSGHPGWDPPTYDHYEGNSIHVKKIIDEETGDYHLIAQGFKGDGDLTVCFNYLGGINKNYGHNKIKIEPTEDGTVVTLLLPNGTPVVPPLSPVEQARLDILGEQISYYFDKYSESVDIHLTGVVAGGSYDPDIPYATEFFMDPGAMGNITITYNNDYINSIVNVVGKNFRVKRVSIFEI